MTNPVLRLWEEALVHLAKGDFYINLRTDPVSISEQEIGGAIIPETCVDRITLKTGIAMEEEYFDADCIQITNSVIIESIDCEGMSSDVALHLRTGAEPEYNPWESALSQSEIRKILERAASEASGSSLCLVSHNETTGRAFGFCAQKTARMDMTADNPEIYRKVFGDIDDLDDLDDPIEHLDIALAQMPDGNEMAVVCAVSRNPDGEDVRTIRQIVGM